MATIKEQLAEMRQAIADLSAETAELRAELGASLEFAFAAGCEQARRNTSRGPRRTRPPHLRSVSSDTRAVKG